MPEHREGVGIFSLNAEGAEKSDTGSDDATETLEFPKIGVCAIDSPAVQVESRSLPSSPYIQYPGPDPKGTAYNFT